MKIEEVIKSNITLDYSKKVILNILYTENIISEKLSELLKHYDLSTEQFNVLRILRGQKGNPINMSVVQERMIAKNSNTTRLIDKLLSKELVTRKICPNNRRKVEVLITKTGLQLLEEIDPKIKRHEQLFSSNLNDEELIQLNLLLEKYRTINN
jgi:DNA-binding MarR family transcriptional regulator